MSALLFTHQLWFISCIPVLIKFLYRKKILEFITCLAATPSLLPATNIQGTVLGSFWKHTKINRSHNLTKFLTFVLRKTLLSSTTDLYYAPSIYGGKYLLPHETWIGSLRTPKLIKTNISDSTDKYVPSYLENITICINLMRRHCHFTWKTELRPPSTKWSLLHVCNIFCTSVTGSGKSIVTLECYIISTKL